MCLLKRVKSKARRKLKEKEQKEKRAEFEKIVLARIDHLDPRELRYLADCLRNNSQSFYTYVHSPYASTLGSKGLIAIPGGTHHQDHYPFIVNDFVWKALLERKDEIPNKDAANIIK